LSIKKGSRSKYLNGFRLYMDQREAAG